MAVRNCSDCKIPMLDETRDIPNEIDLKIYRMQMRKHYPNIMARYTQYSMYICPQCGKLEIFLKKQAESLNELVKKLTPLKVR